MTRELKLALIVGFSLVLVVAVLISDHFSAVRRGSLASMQGDDPGSLQLVGQLPEKKVDFHTPVAPIRETEEPKRPKVPEFHQGSNADNNGLKTMPIDPDGGSATPGTLKPTTKPDKEYAIVEGDSMYKLAKTTYGDASLHAKLAEYNKLVDGKGLKIGQKIMLPAREVLEGKAAPYIKNMAPNINSPAAPGSPRADSPIMKAMETTVVYKVQPGDTLSAIGRKVNASAKTVLELNPALVGHEDELKVGQELKVPKGK